MLLLMTTTATVPETVTLPGWPQPQQEIQVSGRRLEYVRQFAGMARTPEVRMLEQTIVCMAELDRLGKLMLSEKLELNALITQHGVLTAPPKAVEAAAS